MLKSQSYPTLLKLQALENQILDQIEPSLQHLVISRPRVDEEFLIYTYPTFKMESDLNKGIPYSYVTLNRYLRTGAPLTLSCRMEDSACYKLEKLNFDVLKGVQEDIEEIKNVLDTWQSEIIKLIPELGK